MILYALNHLSISKSNASSACEWIFTIKDISVVFYRKRFKRTNAKRTKNVVVKRRIDGHPNIRKSCYSLENDS